MGTINVDDYVKFDPHVTHNPTPQHIKEGEIYKVINTYITKDKRQHKIKLLDSKGNPVPNAYSTKSFYKVSKKTVSQRYEYNDSIYIVQFHNAKATVLLNVDTDEVITLNMPLNEAQTMMRPVQSIEVRLRRVMNALSKMNVYDGENKRKKNLVEELQDILEVLPDDPLYR